jgi:hypothetical protein
MGAVKKDWVKSIKEKSLLELAGDVETCIQAYEAKRGWPYLEKLYRDTLDELALRGYHRFLAGCPDLDS